MPLSPGAKLGHYEVISLLGQGGMGEVYTAKDPRLRRSVVIKVLGSLSPPTPAMRERFLREARAAANVTHPHIVTIYEIGSADNVDYIVMERVDGKPLNMLLTDGPLPVPQALEYAVQMCKAIEAAHSAGVVHRDLKPANVMVEKKGGVKLLDFGVAKFIETQECNPDDTPTILMTQAGTVVGTPAYMSPEQALGGSVDTRSDLFSLGVVLYEMLTGARPFRGQSRNGVLHEIAYDEPSAASFLNPAVTAALDAVLERLLRKNPEQRFQSATELAGALGALASGSRAALKNDPPPAPSVAPVDTSARAFGPRNHSAKMVAAILTVSLVCVLGGVYAYHLWRASPNFSQRSAARELYVQGNAYLLRYDRPGNAERATEALEKAVQLDPNNAAAYSALSDAYRYRGGVNTAWQQKALDSATKAVQLNDYLATAHLNLGATLFRAGKLEQGLAEFRRAAELDPRSAEVHRYLGSAEGRTGASRSADEDFRRAVTLDPQDWRNHTSYGTFLFQQGRVEEAVASFERALQLTPDNGLVQRNLGGAYHQLGRDEEAAAALQRSLEIEPTALAFSNLGTLLFFLGRVPECVTAFEKATVLAPSKYVNWGNLADAYRWLPGHQQNAGEAYRKAIELVRAEILRTPLVPELHADLALYLAKRGNGDDALRELAGINAESRKLPAIAIHAATILEIVGRRREALESLKTALGGGYSPKEVEADPEFADLRRDPAYRRILGSIHKTP
jgi:serine/threonine-protein kinase